MAQVTHIRKINNIIPPVPMSLKIAKYDLDKESYTTASGNLIRNFVASKYKFFLTFPPMRKSQMQTLLQIFDTNNKKISVEYEDIITGSIKTGIFYHGDLEVDVHMIYDESNDDLMYKSFSINLIEY